MGALDTESSGLVSLSSWKTNIEPVSVLDTRRSPSPSTSTSTFSGELRPPISGNTWDALLSDSGQDDFLLRWISNDLINPNPNPNEFELQGSSLSPPPLSSPSGQNPFPQFPNLVPQFPSFATYPEETDDEKPGKPQFFDSFPIQSDPLSHLHQPPLKRPNLGAPPIFGSSTSHPQFPEFDKLPPFGQAIASPEPLPPPKRPNTATVASSGNFIFHPQIPRFDTFGQTKHPNVGDAGNVENPGSFVSDPRFGELYKHPPDTLPVVPQQIVYDQLYKAAEMILSGGNLTNAHSILARLNHQLTPGTLPFQRASFYLKEALLTLPLLGPGSCSLSRVLTPVDGLFRMGAYKLLSEVSPLTNFVNFTSNQAMLEVVGDCELVHVIDFDIGSGAQWASFMTELAILGRNKGSPCLKITAFASPLTHHPFELGLMHENLTQLANEIGVGFELEVVNLDAFDPSSYQDHLFKSGKETMLAVNFPIWAFSNRLVMLPSLIRFIKQLSPSIVVSMEHGYERSDLSFSSHLLHALQYHEALLQSIDAANTNSETVSKIEKFIIQPRIENIVLGRLGYPNQMPHWRSLFAAAGFSQVNVNNFAEIQAECMLNKIQVRGFHVERRQTSLVLSWQGRELVTASAWRC